MHPQISSITLFTWTHAYVHTALKHDAICVQSETVTYVYLCPSKTMHDRTVNIRLEILRQLGARRERQLWAASPEL